MTDIKNIVIIAGQLVVGGAERQLYLWLSNLNREHFNPTVITLHPGYKDYWEKPIEELGIQIFRVNRKKNRLSRLLKIIRIIKNNQPSLIHGWHTFSSGYAGVAGRVLGVRNLGGIRSSFPAIKGTWVTRIMRLACDAVLVNSQSTADAYRAEHSIRKQSVFIVQNAIDSVYEERDTARDFLSSVYGLPKDAVWVASIGRVDPLKRFDVLLRLSSMLNEVQQDVHFVLIGDGPEYSKLVDLANELDIEESVTFIGELPSANRWMKGFDIFCFPSIDEGMPNAVMEAGAAGLPILGWRLPYMVELFPSDNMAMLVEPLNINGMSEALRELVNKKDLRKNLGRAAEEHIQKDFSLERYIQSMTDVYESLLLTDSSRDA